MPEGHSVWPMHLTGDLMSDLPEVSNFGLATEAQYRCDLLG